MAGNDWKNTFEMDYWGLANREALHFILEQDQGELITVNAVSATPLQHSVLMLATADQKRVVLTKDNPMYLLTNYRLVKNRNDGQYLQNYTIFYQKTVDSQVILTVFKVKNDI